MSESDRNPPPRAAGKVSMTHGQRTSAPLVALASIRKIHPAIAQRNSLLDLADSSVANLFDWDPLALDVLLQACPPWVLQRGEAGDRHHVIVAGGQFLPILRRLMPADALIPVLMLESKFQHDRILHIAAAHAAAIAAASCLSLESLQKIIRHAEAGGLSVLAGPASSVARALGLKATGAAR